MHTILSYIYCINYIYKSSPPPSSSSSRTPPSSNSHGPLFSGAFRTTLKEANKFRGSRSSWPYAEGVFYGPLYRTVKSVDSLGKSGWLYHVVSLLSYNFLGDDPRLLRECSH